MSPEGGRWCMSLQFHSPARACAWVIGWTSTFIHHLHPWLRERPCGWPNKKTCEWSENTAGKAFAGWLTPRATGTEVDMAKRPSTAMPKPIQVHLGEPEPDTLRAFGGSKSDRFNNAVIDAMVKT